MWTKNGNMYIHPEYGRIEIKNNGEFVHHHNNGIEVTKPLSDLGSHLQKHGHPNEIHVRVGHVIVTMPLTDAHTLF